MFTTFINCINIVAVWHDPFGIHRTDVNEYSREVQLFAETRAQYKRTIFI